jgi:hypothetical protein
MATKTNPGKWDCIAKADDDEPYFALLGRDKMGAALVRLWAEMREREGDDAEQIADARRVADELEAWAVKLGKPVLTLDSLISFVAAIRGMREDERQRAARTAQSQAQFSMWREGEYACTRSGKQIGIVEKIITFEDGKPPLANVRFGPAAMVSIPVESLRKPLPEELETYHGGRPV